MQENELSGQESMNIIRQMIQVARDYHNENGDGWLIWGWLLFTASLTSAVFDQVNLNRYIGRVWTIMLGIGLLTNFLWYIIKRKSNPVKTYVQELLDKLGTGFFISLF